MTDHIQLLGGAKGTKGKKKPPQQKAGGSSSLKPAGSLLAKTAGRVGLRNKGCWCYANCALQGMAWAARPEALQQVVDSNQPPALANPAGNLKEVDAQLEQNKQVIGSLKEDCARSVMADFLQRMRTGEDPVLNAGAVLAITSETCGKEFNGKTQEDSAEFYGAATAFLAAGIPSLREDCGLVREIRRKCLRCKDSIAKEALEYTLSCSLADQKKVVDAAGLLSTAIEDQAETVTDFQCEKCCRCDESKQAEQEERACECDSCKVKKAEEAKSTCKCEICSRRVDITRTETVKKLPRSLVVKFDRVDPDWRKYGQKLLNKVNLPLETISLHESRSSTASNYQVEGVVKHKGADGKGGHYISCWRLNDATDQESAAWILADDDEVKNCSFQEADGHKNGQAYLMFLRREGPLPNVSDDVKTVACAPPAEENASSKPELTRLRAAVSSQEQSSEVVDNLDLAVDERRQAQPSQPLSADVANGFLGRRIRRRQSCPPLRH